MKSISSPKVERFTATFIEGELPVYKIEVPLSAVEALEQNRRVTQDWATTLCAYARVTPDDEEVKYVDITGTPLAAYLVEAMKEAMSEDTETDSEED